MKQVARKSALSYKAIDNNVVVLDEVKFDSINTKNYVAFVNALNVADEKTLLVLSAQDNNVYLSSRNLKKAKVTTVDQLNTYDVLNAAKLLFTTGSLKTLEEALAK